jgi:hypothetical protein
LRSKSAGEVVYKPISGQFGRGLKGVVLFEEMGGAGDDGEAALAAELCQRLAIEVEDDVILAAYDEQSGSGYRGEPRTGKVGAAASGHHGGDLGVRFAGGPQGGGSSGAGTEVAQPKIPCLRLGPQPSGDLAKPTSQ